MVITGPAREAWSATVPGTRRVAARVVTHGPVTGQDKVDAEVAAWPA
ncbi:hypothetical protein [Saccharothrix sp. NRRL B-16314]|nr:hypothetical protein [Saccharothrix sp. NRRL B-16314]